MNPVQYIERGRGAVTDIAVIAVIGLGVWLWLKKWAPGIAPGLSLLNPGPGGAPPGRALTKADLDTAIMLRDVVLPEHRTLHPHSTLVVGPGPVGQTRLRTGAPAVLGSPVAGIRTETVDAAGAALVARYAAHLAAGLPLPA